MKKMNWAMAASFLSGLILGGVVLTRFVFNNISSSEQRDSLFWTWVVVPLIATMILGTVAIGLRRYLFHALEKQEQLVSLDEAHAIFDSKGEYTRARLLKIYGVLLSIVMFFGGWFSFGLYFVR